MVTMFDVIKTLQLSQMIIGCYINLQALQYKKNGEICHVTEENLKVSLIMYATYFLLFGHFFLGSYIFKSKRANQQIDKQQQQEEKNQNKKIKI